MTGRRLTPCDPEPLSGSSLALFFNLLGRLTAVIFSGYGEAETHIYL